MTTTTEPWFVPAERARKADRLVTHLRAQRTSLDRVAAFTPADRRAVEKAAGVRRASPETWAVALDMLAGSARSRAACQICVLGDPEGPVGPPLPSGHPGLCTHR